MPKTKPASPFAKGVRTVHLYHVGSVICKVLAVFMCSFTGGYVANGNTNYLWLMLLTSAILIGASLILSSLAYALRNETEIAIFEQLRTDSPTNVQANQALDRLRRYN